MSFHVVIRLMVLVSSLAILLTGCKLEDIFDDSSAQPSESQAVDPQETEKDSETEYPQGSSGSSTNLGGQGSSGSNTNSGGQGSQGGFNASEKLDPPKNITVSVVGYQITLQWDTSEKAEYYKIDWGTNNSTVWESAEISNTGKETLTFRFHTSRNETFQVHVVAVNSKQTSSPVITSITTDLSTDIANANIARGGVLYDKWWQLNTEIYFPSTTNPKWPSTINKNVVEAESWQCVNCHGWDYRGKDGVNSNGPSYTGTKGLLSSTPSATNPIAIYRSILDENTHGFTREQLPEQNLLDLIAFIMAIRESSDFQNMSDKFYTDLKLIDLEKTNVSNGKTLYYEDTNIDSCDSCHDIADLADLSLNNPSEFLHKTLFGDIDSSSVYKPLVEHRNTDIHNIQGVVDILAYVQSQTNAYLQRAGRLYDNWAVEAKVSNAPQDTNPIWQNTGNVERTGATTWRCKSCHGWDYLGVSGADGDTLSPYYTNTKGLIELSTTNSTSLFDIIKNGTGVDTVSHNFGQYLDENQIKLLVNFIQSNQGMRTFETEKATADPANGEILFKGATPGSCETCHWTDGTLLAQPIGSIARKNVPLFLHKVRFGHPSSSMIPTGAEFIGLQPQQAYDTLKYAETLSADNSTPDPSYDKASVFRGGRLYDNWWKELRASDHSAQEPTAINPLWKSRHPDIPDLDSNIKTEHSWRCTTCHGWDYEGIGFSTGSKSAFGADNLVYKINLIKDSPLPDAEQQQQLFDWLKLGMSSDLHNFSTLRDGLPTALGDADLWDLVKFLLESVVYTDTYIYEAFKAVKAPYRNTDNAQRLYFGTENPSINCAVCHEQDGRGDTDKGTESIDIFAIAHDKPWEFLHKTRFGQPNTAMPAFFHTDEGTSLLESLQILDFAQQKYRDRAVSP